MKTEMQDHENQENRYGMPRWLVKIQDGSWEPELFISGGAIFTLLQLPSFLTRQSLIIEQETGFIESILIASFMLVAVNGLTIGFISHLVLRGFWIGMVCLSYVYPHGIKYENLDYAPRFKEKVKKFPGIVEFVILLEKACSIVFSLSFIFFLVGLGVLITALIIVPHSGLEEQIGSHAFTVLRYISFFIIGLGGIYMIDFLTLGAVKKIRFLAPVYYPIYRFFSLLSLARLYRGPYYTFISNVKQWQAVLTIVGWLGLSLAMTAVISPWAIEQEESDPRFFLGLKDPMYRYNMALYDDNRKEDDLIQKASIPSELLSGEYLKLFIVHHQITEPAIHLLCQSNRSMQMSDMQKLDCLNLFYLVFVDGEQMVNVRWRQYTHPQTGESGIMAYLLIDSLEVGEHNVQVNLNIPENTPNLQKLTNYGFVKENYVQIPFWKE